VEECIEETEPVQKLLELPHRVLPLLVQEQLLVYLRSY
jgi:hypothetical protein